MAAASPTAATPGITAGTDWETALLEYIGAPTTPDNYRFLNAWALREHGPSYRTTLYANNPFFTTAGGSGSATVIGGSGKIPAHSFPLIPDSAFPGGRNTAGVPMYPDVATGVVATGATLQQYPTILSALRSGQPQNFAAQMSKELSTWSGSGYSGLPLSSAPAMPTGPAIEHPLESMPGGDASKGAVPGPTETAKGVASAVTGWVQDILDFLKQYAIRVAEVVGGGLLVVAGFFILTRGAVPPIVPIPV